MKQIISVSRRTDIPAFYSEWFMSRIRAGFCRIINPLYPEQKTHPLDLSPEAVECFVFWTRNPKPLLLYLDELDAKGYLYYFLYTVIGYPEIFDPGSPVLDDALQTFQELSRRIGPERVMWRYDPIIFSDMTAVKWHQQRIVRIAQALKGFTKKMIFSFVIDYGHAKERYQKVKEHGACFFDKKDTDRAQEEMVQWIGRTLPDFGIIPAVCADRRDFSAFGIAKAQCIDRALINQLTGFHRKYRKDPAQRADCCCSISRDIGANNTCLAGCFYCYAVKDFGLAKKNFGRHDPQAEHLISPDVF